MEFKESLRRAYALKALLVIAKAIAEDGAYGYNGL
jgi:hypothetical protein